MSRVMNFALGVAVIVLLAILYNVRYDADAQIGSIRLAESAIGDALTTRKVMQAEWVSLNNPERLENLSDQYLKMRPLQAEQLEPLNIHLEIHVANRLADGDVGAWAGAWAGAGAGAGAGARKFVLIKINAPLNAPLDTRLKNRVKIRAPHPTIQKIKLEHDYVVE